MPCHPSWHGRIIYEMVLTEANSRHVNHRIRILTTRAVGNKAATKFPCNILYIFFLDWEAVVKLSDDFNGADLRNVCTEAGENA